MEGLKICLDIFEGCAKAILQGELIHRVSATDKEFHFQNWFQARVDSLGFKYHESGRNTYPDFPMVAKPVGFEVKGLAWPGRYKNYDCNSQVPSGKHNGMDIFYVFGRYPAPPKKGKAASQAQAQDPSKYPVIDLVICHGDFMNADHDYEHLNRSVKGFGSYGDIMIRDRKMYVAPTPFALMSGVEGLRTLVLPADLEVDARFVRVGELTRRESDQLVAGYEFDLAENTISAKRVPNPSAGKEHRFYAYRVYGDATREVSMVDENEIKAATDDVKDE
jgi:hypothetical protein